VIVSDADKWGWRFSLRGEPLPKEFMSLVKRSRDWAILASSALVGQMLAPVSLWAFQSHPAPEGLYAHQLAHGFFIVAMGFLAYWLQFNRLAMQKGWRLIQSACLLFILWNVVAIAGHWVEERIPREVLQGDPDWTQRIDLSVNTLNYAYYILKLDHLVCVPAMICLLLGVRALHKKVVSEEPFEDE
jgi:hypothetical protein